MATIMSNDEVKTALITGASSGIGREFARLFAKDGYDLIIIALPEERLRVLADSLKREYGTKSMVIPKDLSQLNSPKEIFDSVKQAGISVDVLINDAGFAVYGNFYETNYEKELSMIQVNCIALTYLTKLILPEMIKRGSGKILNMGSMGSIVATPFNAVYCATKAYVLNMSLAIGEELKNSGVSLTCLCPGVVKTDLYKVANMEKIKIMKGTVLSAEKVAKIGYKGLMKGKRMVVPGLINKLHFFITHLVSRKRLTQIARSYMEVSEKSI
jgi:short-subunit dehydrogenase